MKTNHIKSKIEFAENNQNLEKTNIDKKTSQLTRGFWGAIGAWSVYNLIDIGLARFFALETLTHGTGPLGYIGISLYGADPAYGGGNTGSSVTLGNAGYVRNSKNYFHVYRDSAITSPCEGFDRSVCHFLPILTARVHAMGSGMANFGSSTTEGVNKAIRSAIGGIAGLLTPTLKFRFKPEAVLNCNESCRFQNDPDYGGLAYRTAEAIPSSHLGITGSLTQGIDSEMLSRMTNNSEKVLLGCAMLGAALITARATYQYLKAEPENTISIPIETSSRWEQCKKTVTVMTKAAFWISFGATAIVLNTL